MSIARTIRFRGRPAAGALACLLVLGATALAPSDARAQAVAPPTPEEAEALQKAEWQDRYRTLRINAVRMRDNATTLRRNYGLAQHANYPRGGARVRFKQEVEDTERKADQFEAQLARFMDEARENQIPPGWIYEVDDEPIDRGFPADRDGDGSGEDEFAPSGRNPVHFDSRDDSEDDRDAEVEDESDADKDEDEEGYGDDEDGEEDDGRYRPRRP